MEYKHISECWNKIRECKKTSEVEKLFREFPRWSGDWEIVRTGEAIEVVNDYYDEQCEVWEQDSEFIEVEDDLFDGEE